MSDYVSQRALDDLIDFLRLNTHQGRCTMSIQDMADRLKYSATTLHRAVRKLEEDGIIDIQRAEKQTEPNTIVYKGKSIDDGLLAEGSKLCRQAGENHRDLVNHIDLCHRLIRKLKTELDHFNEVRSRVVSSTPISDDYESIVLKRPHKEYRTVL